jgi:hypothetical protein
MAYIGNAPAQGSFTGSNIKEGTITADNLSETAITDKLGFTPISESDVQDQISDLVDSAPTALDTLNELAAALGDDANFASTVTTALGGKQATLVSGTNIKTINNTSLLGSGNIVATTPEANTSSPGTVYGISATYNTQVSNSGNSGVGRGVSLGTSSCYGNSFLGADVNIGNSTYRSVVIGRAARVNFESELSVSVGDSSIIYNNSGNSVSIGGGAYVEAGKPSSIVLGANARSNGSGSIAIGSRAWTQGTNSIRIGRHNQNYQDGLTADGSIGIGYQIGDNGYNIIAFNSDPSTGFYPSSSGFYVTNVTSDTTSDVLYYDPTTKKITYGAAPEGGGSGDVALEDLTNVSISSPTSGQVLKYNGTAWVNSTDETGGDTGGGGGGGGQVTSGSGVTYFSGPGQNSFGNVTIYFDTPTLAATFYNTVTQNFTAISAVSQSLSQGTSAYIRIQAPSVSWQGSPALCQFSLSTQSFTYTPGNDYVSGQAFVSTGPGSGSGNWTYNDEAFNWNSNVNTFSYGGGQCTVNFYNPTAADIYTVAALLVPKPPIALGVAGYLTNNFANAFTSFGGVALSGSAPTSSTQFTFTYTSVNFEFPSQGNYVVLSGSPVIPT